MRKKVTIVGAGQTGGTMAMRLAETGLADVVLTDIVEGLPQGKALDIAESLPVLGVDAKIVGTNDWADTANSDVVVITSGVPRKPGMTREDLLNTNAGIVKSVAEQAAKASPNAVIILFANPMDAMCHVTLRASGFPRERVVGQGGMLDTTRYRTFIAWEANVSVKSVDAWVLGGHTEATMVPLVSNATIGGVPLTKVLQKERIEAVVQRAKGGGAEIVALLKSGSAFYAPAAATIEMVKSIINDEKRLFAAACYCQGEYGVKDAFVGVMCKLGAKGIEQILEPDLWPDELEAIRAAAASTKELVSSVTV